MGVLLAELFAIIVFGRAAAEAEGARAGALPKRPEDGGNWQVATATWYGRDVETHAGKS